MKYQNFAKRLIKYPVVYMLTIVLFATSCKTQQATQQTISRDNSSTVAGYTRERDSIYVYENNVVYVKGDTVYVVNYKAEFRNRFISDTLKLTDTVKLENTLLQTKTKYENRLNGFQKFQIKGFWILLILFILIVAIKILYKIYIKR